MTRAGTTLTALLACIAGGCQSYERKPLDLPAHRAAFLARTAGTPEVQAFAAGLEPSQASTVPAFDPGDGVSLPEAELIALVFNADLRIGRLKAGVTRASADNAGLWDDPTIGVDLTRIIQATPDPWKVFATVGLTLPVSGRLEIEKQRAGLNHAVQLARVALAEWQTRAAVRRAWTEWTAAQAQLDVTRDLLTQVEQVVSVVDKMEQAGEMARTEARLFRVQRANEAAEIAALEAQVRQMLLKLKQLMGLPPDAKVEFQAQGIGPASLPAAALDLTEHAFEGSPSVLVAAAEYEMADKTLELEVRKQYPDLHIGPGYGNDDGQDQLLFGLSAPVPLFNGNRQGIAEARAQREVARASADAALEQLVSGARAAQMRVEAAMRQRQAIESEIVPLVDAQYADARQIARLGEVNTLVLLESLSQQRDAKVRLIAARREEALAGIDLMELLGPEPRPMRPPPIPSYPSTPTSNP